MDISTLLWTIHAIGYAITLFFAIQVERRASDHGDSELIFNAAAFGLICWFFVIPSIIERRSEINISHARMILNGQAPPTPRELSQRAREKRNITKAWDRYYTYLGERHALGMSHPHPGPEVLEPSSPDPRGKPECKRSCHDYYMYDMRLSKCSDPTHTYPEPSTNRLARLLAATVKATEDARRKKAARIQRIRHEYEALGYSPHEQGLDSGPE